MKPTSELITAITLTLILTACSTSTPAVQSVPTSQPTQNVKDLPNATQSLQGTLPLQRGVYVIEGSGCASPANAVVRIYNGTGLSGSSTRECRTTVRSQDGSRYEVDQSCENTYDGTRTSESQTITVSGDQHFVLGSARYGLCPSGQTPKSMEQLAR